MYPQKTSVPKTSAGVHQVANIKKARRCAEGGSGRTPFETFWHRRTQKEKKKKEKKQSDECLRQDLVKMACLRSKHPCSLVATRFLVFFCDLGTFYSSFWGPVTCELAWLSQVQRLLGFLCCGSVLRWWALCGWILFDDPPCGVRMWVCSDRRFLRIVAVSFKITYWCWSLELELVEREREREREPVIQQWVSSAFRRTLHQLCCGHCEIDFRRDCDSSPWVMRCSSSSPRIPTPPWTPACRTNWPNWRPGWQERQPHSQPNPPGLLLTILLLSPFSSAMAPSRLPPATLILT